MTMIGRGGRMAAQGSLEIGELTQFALDTVRSAGKEALRFYGKGNLQTKFDSELVTEAELRLVDLFKDRLKASFPEHEIFEDGMPSTEYEHGSKRYL
ncbi:MAG: hypothetical protein HGB17_06325 [Syntrophobacteraceae bacterium]|nr:hypothetical protein [Syntrophobacteraceae bacterium]